jgi:hypothetical protein
LIKRGVNKMIFLKHVQHKLGSRDDLQSILAHIRETAKKVPGVRLRDFFILQERDEFILVMDCLNETAYQEWRDLCPPPPGAKDWVEPAILAEDFSKSSK